jgi:hypothetical protein
MQPLVNLDCCLHELQGYRLANRRNQIITRITYIEINEANEALRGGDCHVENGDWTRVQRPQTL